VQNRANAYASRIGEPGFGSCGRMLLREKQSEHKNSATRASSGAVAHEGVRAACQSPGG
jgi:hypothetical protein